MKWIGSKKSKRYERDCSPWKHISQRATKHEKRSVESCGPPQMDRFAWKEEEVNHYYIVELKVEKRWKENGKVDRSFCVRCLFQWIIWKDINQHKHQTPKCGFNLTKQLWYIKSKMDGIESSNICLSVLKKWANITLDVSRVRWYLASCF